MMIMIKSKMFKICCYKGERSRAVRKIIPILTLLVLLPSWAWSATSYTASSCSVSNVQSAINSCIGDSQCTTVNIPGCSSTAWSSQLTVNPGSKNLTITGAGIGNTTIAPTITNAIVITYTNGHVIKWDNMTIDMSGESGPLFQTTGNGSNIFEFGHLSFINMGNVLVWRFTAYQYGVIDNCTFAGAGGEIAQIGDATIAGCQGWVNSTPWNGTANAVYFENNTVSWNDHNEGVPLFDNYGGGRVVIRYNKFTGVAMGNHGADSAICGGQGIELYNNTFSYPGASGSTWNITGGGWRGGRVIAYNNTFDFGQCDMRGSIGNTLKLSLYRAPGGYYPAWSNSCTTGNNVMFLNTVNSNWTSSSNGPYDCLSGSNCKWKLCSGASNQGTMTLCQSDSDCSGQGTCSFYADGPAGGGYPCFNEPGGTGPGNTVQPGYEWNNTCTGGQYGPCVGGDTVVFSVSAGPMQQNRDYFDCGTSKCAGFNYTAYTYPHPLTQSTPPPTGSSPSPPQNLQIQP